MARSVALATTAATAAVPKKTSRPTITLEYVEALKAYSEVLFKGGMCPKPQKGESARAETVAAILEVGKDIGLPATQALANIRITNGRPAIFGDAALALIRSSGLLEDIEETFEGTPFSDDFTAVCRLKRKGAARDRVERFSVADARRAELWGSKEGPWKTAPRRMLMFRARGFACRDEFGDVLCGLIFVEEANDITADSAGGSVRVSVPVQVVTQPEPTQPPAITQASTVANPAPAPALPAGTAAPDACCPEQDPQATREQLIERLAELRGYLLTARNFTDHKSEEARAEWAKVLAPLGVASAKELPDDKLRDLVVELAKTHDPF